MSYEIKGVPTKITATSRSSIHIKENYYTIEASEERTMPESEGIDVEKEFDALFNEVNDVVDKQVKEIVDTFK